MTDRSDTPVDDRDVADLQAEIARLRRDLGDIGDTLRILAAREWRALGASLYRAAATQRTRVAAKISAPSERLIGIAFCIGAAAGLLMRVRRIKIDRNQRRTPPRA